MAVTKEFISQAGNGQRLAIGTAATSIHQAHATSRDECWIYAGNLAASDLELALLIGGGEFQRLMIPAKSGLVLVVPGLVVSGSLVLAASTTAANSIYVVGYVNRITP